MGLSDIADDLLRRIEQTQDEVSAMLFEPVIRLGVTGLSRAGKTVFITSLVANLLDRGRMSRVSAVAQGRVEAAVLRPQPDDGVPRFAYETHLDGLMQPEPVWPESTRAVSQLRVSIRVRPQGWLSGLTGARTVHLDIIDYPGEWLLDLPLLDQTFETWSARTLAAARAPARASLADGWLAQLEGSDPSAPLDETTAAALADAFRGFLAQARLAGQSSLAPGRFLMPGDLEGSPALTFCPLPDTPRARSQSLYRAFERRFEAYKRIVVKPFFRDHFARIDRQIVLVDLLSALHTGPAAVADMRDALGDILSTFRPGTNSWLSAILGKRVERILVCATRADHLHHTQHAALGDATRTLVRDAIDRADFSGAETHSLAIASLRATIEETRRHDGRDIDCVRGRLSNGKDVIMHPGDLPVDPANLAGQGILPTWSSGDFAVQQFAPPRLTRVSGDGLPHIRLDQAAEFLIGDRLE